jgi:chromosome segregation ATPase
MGPAGAAPAGGRALVPVALLSYQTRRAGYRGVTYFSVRNVVAVFGALFVLALAFLILADGREAGAVLDVFRSQSLLSKLAWVIIVLVPLIVVPSAVWLGETLVRQRQAAHALELRLDGVRQGVKSLVRSQADADAAVHQLIRSDPEEAIGAMKQRLGEAERVAHVQKGRNEIGDLGSRVEEIRTQQQALQKRLGPVLEKRRAIDQLFAELDSRQHDIERTLAEVGGGNDAVALDIGLQKMTEFVRQSHERCDEIERASKVMGGLQEDYSDLQKRLAPFAAADDGVVRRVKDLGAARDRLAAEIGSLEQTPQGPLAARVQRFAEERNTLDGRLSQLDAQFTALSTLRGDITGLFSHFHRALDALADVDTAKGEGAAAIDDRVGELATFIEATQAHLDEIERRAVAFAQLKGKLGELQSRLHPLQAEEGGVADLVGEVREIRDWLFAKIRQIEEDEDGGLAERVKKFTETKRELEERVSNLTEQFSKLATIRKDITGLFEKLSGAVNTSAN